MSGVRRIAAERERQIELEGYDIAHDAQHTDGALAYAAACYAAPDRIFRLDMRETLRNGGVVTWWEPWPMHWRRPERPEFQTDADRIRDLEKAGALIAAEIDRLEARADV